MWNKVPFFDLTFDVSESNEAEVYNKHFIKSKKKLKEVQNK